jgi:Na+-translocating ferredoxin:NAD+ oxidoreductase subunit B
MNPSSTSSAAGSGFNRRDFLRGAMRAAALTTLGGLVGAMSWRSMAGATVWQLDPQKCVRCGQCATACVLQPSAVKCVHTYSMCGYCELCTGYFEPDPNDLNTGAENQVCPTAAIIRTFIEDPYFEYKIDENLCIGCARCVEGCNLFGNGSLHLQVRHDLCVDCNECAIARVCPGDAFRRVPVHDPYIAKEIAH